MSDPGATIEDAQEAARLHQDNISFSRGEFLHLLVLQAGIPGQAGLFFN
jgi:hypothetical protein